MVLICFCTLNLILVVLYVLAGLYILIVSYYIIPFKIVSLHCLYIAECQIFNRYSRIKIVSYYGEA
uniref:Uncharacterized protein n=1 Tax=Anguilla anguilla TaxID=7936 RepID=A0A0E9T1D8_ANGAN